MQADPSTQPQLTVVIPVYNEHASIRKVIIEWNEEIAGWTEDFQILVINDGSTDGTLEILERLQQAIGTRLQVVTQKNAGHGQACLHGYRMAAERGARHILQIDSDGQCDPQYFFKFWREREAFDVIYGVRKHRDDGFKRVVASLVLRIFLLATTRVNCRDANVPYRLMRTTALQPEIDRMPASFSLVNIGLAVLLGRASDVRHGYVPIRFRERYGGEPHVALSSFGSKALELRTHLQSIS